MVHGVDYDHSGAYHVGAGRGPEEDLDPAEAAIPAEARRHPSCGMIRVAKGQGQVVQQR